MAAPSRSTVDASDRIVSTAWAMCIDACGHGFAVKNAWMSSASAAVAKPLSSQGTPEAGTVTTMSRTAIEIRDGDGDEVRGEKRQTRALKSARARERDATNAHTCTDMHRHAPTCTDTEVNTMIRSVGNASPSHAQRTGAEGGTSRHVTHPSGIVATCPSSWPVCLYRSKSAPQLVLT
jgi:hypothetical protein